MMTTVLDPVCGMTVDPARAAGRVEHQGETYYFCSKGCAAKFAADPERYTSRFPTPSHQPPATQYTCPMHPEIVSDRPGACPKCGMALESRTVAMDEGPSPELVDMSRRFWIGLALAVPVFVLGMLHLLDWLQLVLATPVVLWCGWP